MAKITQIATTASTEVVSLKVEAEEVSTERSVPENVIPLYAQFTKDDDATEII